MNDWTDRLNAAMEAARHAGAMLRGRRDFHVENKSAKDFVTDADRASEQMIISELSARYPEDGFYGEEGGVRKKSEGMWVIDPIDGTTNFIKNIPLYTISIAYLRAGEVVGVCGVEAGRDVLGGQGRRRVPERKADPRVRCNGSRQRRDGDEFCRARAGRIEAAYGAAGRNPA